ncbi:mechanosensitive ion channel [Halorubellus sp. JP-L1]|uniref:mechanosensitive ion channel family protein n=1 Tax=Halorubellus sp. JP-L1 TaxID=2715753 RepID=UPI00140DC6BA|nr:mechanosensitive ion channel [Halorubellus sp. JP-L1]
MKRSVGYGSLLVAALIAVGANVLSGTWEVSTANEVLKAWTLKGAIAFAVALATYGSYVLVSQFVARWATDKRRIHDVRNLLRLAFGLVGAVGVAGALTDQWLGVVFSLGVAGFAVTFALQTPILSVIGWVYIMAKRPYSVGDRVRIEDAKGDVVDVSFLVTTLWEVQGDLVTTHQPSGRTVTVPNAVVLDSQVFNYTQDEFPFVWAELPIQLSYETDLEYAREVAQAVADDYLGDEMAARVERHRERIADSPVDLEVKSRPSVNVSQSESWVELRVRFLTRPRGVQATRNELYARILDRYKENPDRVSYPVGRPR